MIWSNSHGLFLRCCPGQKVFLCIHFIDGLGLLFNFSKARIWQFLGSQTSFFGPKLEDTVEDYVLPNCLRMFSMTADSYWGLLLSLAWSSSPGDGGGPKLLLVKRHDQDHTAGKWGGQDSDLTPASRAGALNGTSEAERQPRTTLPALPNGTVRNGSMTETPGSLGWFLFQSFIANRQMWNTHCRKFSPCTRSLHWASQLFIKAAFIRLWLKNKRSENDKGGFLESKSHFRAKSPVYT